MARDPEEGHGGDQADDRLVTRALRERLGRYPASPRLRAALLQTLEPEAPGPRWGVSWLVPAVSALATAVVMIFWVAGGLPTALPGDTLRDLTRAVVTEHARTLSWVEAQPDVVAATLPRVMDESGVTLNLLFTGDSDIRLVNAHPTYVEGHRGLSLAYMDARGHGVTYVIFPGASLVALPERERVKIETWRPVVRKESGFSLIMWKQQGLFCVLVADLVSDDDLARLKEYFVKVRSATDLYQPI
jgi:hypothetical protein